MKRPRVALFSSYYAGFFVLSRLLNGCLNGHIEVCFLATDDPQDEVSNHQARIWQYPHTTDEAEMTRRLASEHGIPTWLVEVSSERFVDALGASDPDVAVMACFGQRITQPVIDLVRGQFWNVHPGVPAFPWPNFHGPDVWEQLIESEQPCFAMFLHEVVEGLDASPEICRSDSIPIPPRSTPVDLNYLQGPTTAVLVETHLANVFDLCLQECSLNT